MNTFNLIEKLKIKVKDTDEFVENTTVKQRKLLNSSNEFNLKIRNYLEADIMEKNSYTDSQEKLGIVKSRIEISKQNITNIKDKIKILKIKYDL